jgi:hypothetical protein
LPGLHYAQGPAAVFLHNLVFLSILTIF